MRAKNRRFSFIGLSLFSFIFACHLGCTRLKVTNPFLPKPHVLLITIDTLRPDHLGCYGYRGIRTPNIDRLATEGVIFTQSYTPVPITLPSHTTIMTGLYPIQTGVRDNGTCRVSQETTTMAEILQKQGYRTAAFVGAYVLDSRYGLDQGFDVYDDTLSREDNEQTLFIYNERKAEQVTKAALAWFDQTSDSPSPFFAWIHYFDPHANHQPPSPFDKEYSNNLYDGEIAYTDHWIGILLESLEKRGLLDNTLIILTSDHGEGLGEHGEQSHAIFIYDATLHVPLIIRYPQKLQGSKKVDQFVRTLDMMPTILSLLNLPSPVNEGIDLTKIITAQDKNKNLELYCETLFPLINHGWSPLEGMRTWDWKYIMAPRSEIYHLTKDQKEINNLYDQETKLAENFKHRLESLKEKIMRHKAPKDTGLSLDQETRDRLKSLGYIWTVKESNTGREMGSLPDPKDMIHIQGDIDYAAGLIDREEYREARDVLVRILKENPQDIFAHFILGRVYTLLKEKDLARDEFLQVIEMNPEYADVRVCLGILYLKEREYEKAIREFMESMRLNADQYEIFYNLGLAYSGLNQDKEALNYFKQALAIKPDQPDIYNNMGVILAGEGKIEEAISAYHKAIELDPDNPKPLRNLVFLYQKGEEWEKARLELEKVVRMDSHNLLARLNLGLVLGNLGQNQAAIQEYKKVLEIDPNCAQSYFNLGVAYGQEQELDKAKEAYNQAIKLSSDYPEAYLNLGFLYLKEGNPQAASDEWQKVLTIDPHNIKAHFNLGNIALSQGHFNQAVHEYNQVLVIDQGNAEAHFGLGAAYINEGKVAEAIREWEETIRLKPDNLEARMNLAVAYANQRRLEQAKKMIYQVLELNPALPMAQDLLRKINELEQNNPS